MQSIKILVQWLQQHATQERYLFSVQDFRGLFPELSNNALKTLLSRAARQGILEKICRSIYAFESGRYSNGLLLFHVAAHLRAGKFNYVSLETVLSDAGIISQIPINSVSIMSSGRSNRISCGRFGVIEFIHTNQRPESVAGSLRYDSRSRLWCANVELALRDMKYTHRNCDLINWELASELV